MGRHYALAQEAILAAIATHAAPALYGYGGIYWATHFESIDGYEQDINGGSITLDYYSLHIFSGASSGNYALLTDEPGFHVTPPTWDKKRKFIVACYFSNASQAQCDQWLVTGYGGEWGSTKRHCGFKNLDGTLYGTVGDGSVETTLNFGATPVSQPNTILEAILIPGIECRFYVNDVDKGAITTNLPTGTISAKHHFFIQSKTTENITKEVRLSEWRFLQEA